MPAWWSRKSHKNKEDHHSSLSPNSKKTSSARSKENSNNYSNNRRFDEAAGAATPAVAVTPSILSPRILSPGNCGNNSNNCRNRNNDCRKKSRELGPAGGSGGGSSGFDSDGERRGHPLPRPSFSNDHGVTGLGTVVINGGGGSAGLGAGSGSISSVSSSGSSDEQPHILDPAQFVTSRGADDGKQNAQPRSPGTRSRGPTICTSPLHPRIAAMNIESLSGSSVKIQCHPLPLPPNSPTSPPSAQNGRSAPPNGNINCILSKWRKGKLLGKGTFGHVYLGFNSEGGQMGGQFCAIKEVKVISDDQNSRECLKQLNQEINMLSQLQHPNIVHYYGSELAEETLSVYLEFVSGGSIYKLLQDYGPFKEPVIQNYTRQILSGLAYLHARTTVHRDIKGANILVSTNGVIKLADFGMAKHITSCASVLSFKGSPYWMAPEVVMNTNGYNLAVDIWSLGCTVLEMATSKPPWSQYSGVTAIFKIGNSKDIPDIPDFLSNDAKSFVKLCLQRDPSVRPTAAELLDHPFVRVHTPTRIPNMNVTVEASPFTFDSSHKPKPLEIQPRRKSISSHDVDNIRRPVPVVSRTWRDNSKTITSLPVSPCSSPLRQFGTPSKSCFLSPTHPSYTWAPQSSYSLMDHSISPTRANAGFTLDPWLETPLVRTQTPCGSPRRYDRYDTRANIGIL